jgi:diketogulonate reductase-like aldo/keto reductase
MPSRTSQETVQLTGGASIPLIGFGPWQLQGAEAYDGDERIEENLNIFDFELTAQNLRRLNAMAS